MAAVPSIVPKTAIMGKNFLPFIAELDISKKLSNAKAKEIFLQKKSWSEMIQKYLIRREKAKKLAADGGFRRYRRCFFKVK